MACPAQRLSPVADGVWLLSVMGEARGLGTNQRGVGASSPSDGGTKRRTQFDHHRQPVRQTRTKGGEEQGFDGNKKVKGRKRHIVTDVLGLVLGCYVSSANTADVKAAPAVLVWVLELYPRIVKVLADQGYRGNLGQLIEQFFAQEGRQVELELSQRPTEAQGFQVEAKRWIVERTWTWLENARSLTRDYERLPENHEGMIYVVMIRLMLRRLTKNRKTWEATAA